MNNKNIKNFYNFLEQEVKPQADLINNDKKKLTATFKKMAQLGVFGVDVPVALGGLELDIAERHYFLRNIERTSAALSLLQIQHQSACKVLSLTDNKALQKKYLSRALSGKVLIGIAFAHLRCGAANAPMRSIADSQGYIVSGHLRFVSGYKIF